MVTHGGRLLNLYTQCIDQDGFFVRTKCVVVAIDDDEKAKEKGWEHLGSPTPDEFLCTGVLTKEQIQDLGMKNGEIREFMVGELPEKQK